jgi:hypothetical protein
MLQFCFETSNAEVLILLHLISIFFCVQATDGPVTTLGVRSRPAGTYVLRINTVVGLFFKKLVLW